MGGRLDPTVALGRRAVRDVLASVEPDTPLTVGLSGGADSLALAACVAFVADRDGWDAAAVVIDHGLQDGSRDVAERAAAQAQELGMKSEVVRVVVDGPGGPEAAAREARYAALLDRPGVVLLAHTRDDQAETVLLGLGRGSGPRSIAGMRPVDGRVLRPLLELGRADTEQICRASDLDWWNDPHNVDSSFRRVRVRREVLPLLEDVLGGGAAEALARTASQLRDDTDLLDALAAEVSEPQSVDVLAALPPALRSRVLRRLALDAGARASELGAVHLAELDRLVTAWHGQGAVELPGGVALGRQEGRLLRTS